MKPPSPATARTPLAMALDGLLLLAIATFVVLYLASIGPYWNISPDSATYVGWAKALVAGVPYERGPVQPPATSLVYAAILSVTPDGFTALNAASVLLVLTALGFAFAWARRHTSRTEALLVVLLSLASTRLYHESTQLLSEPPYLLFSMLALWLVDRPSPDAVGVGTGASTALTRRGTVLAGTMLIATVLTRTIGLALVLAVLFVEAWRLVRRQASPSWLLVGFAVSSIVAMGLWEAFGVQQPYATNWFRMFLLEDVWSSGSAPATLPGLLRRAGEHAGQVPAAGRLLLNSWVPANPALSVLVPTAALILCLAGVAWSALRRVSVPAVYVLLYLAVITAHSLGGGGDPYRLLVPVLPLLIFYALEAARVGMSTLAARSGPARAITIAGALAVALYVGVGAGAFRRGVPEAHGSPFGEYPVKRPSNFDAQRLAMWIAEHSRPEDTFASWQRDMFEVLAERRGYPLSAGRITPADSFVSWLGAQRIRFLLVDHRSGAIGDSLRVAVRRQPHAFRLVSALRDASLYEVIPRGSEPPVR